MFTSPETLQEARSAVRCCATKHHGRVLWLDAAKTRDELRPARLVHRAATAIENMENKFPEPDRLAVEKVMNGKQVKAGGKVMLHTYRGNWQWSSDAADRYKPDQMQMVTGWNESE